LEYQDSHAAQSNVYFSDHKFVEGTLAICGGNDGKSILNTFYLVSFKNGSTTPSFS